jgi:hypothetical protein
MARFGVRLPLASAVVMAVAALAPVIAAAQARSGVPRAADGKPDLQGIWQVRNTAWADLLDHPATLGDGHSARTGIMGGLSVVEGGEIPYLPEARKTMEMNRASGATLDPVSKCYMPGTPRVMYLPFPFQIFQTSKYIAIVSEYSHTYRIIYTDGSKHIDGIEFWMGDSRGHWEGDTLVVDVTNHNDKTWFDMAGNHHSEALHLVERLTRTDADTLMYEVMVEDPKTYSRPWKMRMPIYRHRPAERDRLLEYECGVLLEEAAGSFVDLPEAPSVQP